jgi:hypothetical protein
MSAFDDLAKKASDFIGDNKEQIDAALKSEQAEDISDKILDGAEDAANKVTGGKFEGQIKGARDAADGAIGNK